MIRAAATLLALAALAVGAGTASANAPTGWSATKAAAAVTAQVRLPWCRVYSNWKDSYGRPVCADGKAVTPEARAHEPLRVANVTCTGLPGTPARGALYTRLRCGWQWNNSPEHGTVLVYVTGPSSFRWKST